MITKMKGQVKNYHFTLLGLKFDELNSPTQVGSVEKIFLPPNGF
jgi:hypothetical protein